MQIEVGPIVQETIQETTQPASQPPAADPLSDDAVRAAIASAEAQGLNPETLKVGDLPKGEPKPEPVQTQAKPDVPEKFLKTDGEVDVEKLITSTQQLDEALQKKQEAVSKTIDDYLREYREKEAKFKNLPNPQKLAAQLPSTPAPVAQAPDMPVDQNLGQIIRKDFEIDPIETIVRLAEIISDRKIAPYETERKDNRIRSNIEELAKKDPRILDPQIYAAVNAKLESDPDLWRLKNPHKAAYLEVKEEMRLGEPPAKAAQAQPSRPPTPILGGGTPPSSPSSAGPLSHAQILKSFDQLDPRDKKQEEAGDAALRALLQQSR